jgi:hypothetical protein
MTNELPVSLLFSDQLWFLSSAAEESVTDRQLISHQSLQGNETLYNHVLNLLHLY